MRPDHHKKRKNARYKKAHGMVDKKEENSEGKEVPNNKPKKKAKSNKKSQQPQKKPIEKLTETDKENEKKENNQNSGENSEEDEDFQKREICSNWSRYEESSTEEELDEEEDDDDFSDDDFDLKGMIERGTKKFQIDEGKSWVREADEKDALPLNVEDFNKEFFEVICRTLIIAYFLY